MSQSLLLECKQTKRFTNLRQEDFRLATRVNQLFNRFSILLNSLIKIYFKKTTTCEEVLT